MHWNQVTGVRVVKVSGPGRFPSEHVIVKYDANGGPKELMIPTEMTHFRAGEIACLIQKKLASALASLSGAFRDGLFRASSPGTKQRHSWAAGILPGGPFLCAAVERTVHVGDRGFPGETWKSSEPPVANRSHYAMRWEKG